MAEARDRLSWRYVSHIIAAVGNSVGADCKASDFDPYSDANRVVMASADEWKLACSAMSRVEKSKR